ncbi:hypothetical protein CBS101457_000720 [Exobasidium rhododendri]|nr:hypothetical protein CBS101457_000720 [Exobasidium rhododendri]
MSRMSGRCILRFSPVEIQIIVPKGIDSVETWACLDDLPAFFSEYRVESNNDNQVNLEVLTESLLHALRSASSPGADCVIKLAKRDKDPVLSLEIATKVGFSEG